MAINKKLITFDKKSTFLGANGINNVSSPTDGYYHNIPEWSMVFILETGEIWHNGKYFGKPIKDQIFPATSQLTKGIVFMNNDDYYYRSFNLWGNVFDGSVRDINGELVVQGETYKWTYGDGVIRKGNANLIAFSGLSGVYDVFIPSGDLSVTSGDLKVGNNITLASTGSIKGTHILNTNSYFNLDYSLGKTWNSIKLFNTSGTLISLDSTRPAIINIQAGVYASGTNWQPWITGGDVTELSSWGIGLGGDAFYIGRIDKTNTENSLSQYWKFDSEDGITISGTTKYIKVANLAGASEKIFMADGTVKALSDITSEALIGEATTTSYGGFKLTQNKSSVQQTLVSNTIGNGRYAVKMNADGTLFVEFVLANTWLPATNTLGGYVPQLSGSNDAIGSNLNDYVLTFTSSDAETIYPTWRRLPSNAFENTTYSTATSSELGLVKVGTTLDSTTGFTAVHIKDGKIYYKDTTYSFSNLKFQLTSGTDLMTYNSLSTKTILAGTGITFSYLNNVLTISSAIYSTATDSMLGLVKIGTTLDNTDGYTKVHIDSNGFIYYHDTTYSFSKLKFQQTSGTDLMTYDSQAARTILAGDNITFTHNNNVLTIKATDTTYSAATSSVLGLIKIGTTLDDVSGYTKVHIKDGFAYYHDTTYSFSKLKFLLTAGTDLMTYDSLAVRTIVAGDNITFTHSNNVLTIKATDTTYSTATSSALGLVKVGDTIDNTTGYTAVHINNGKIYYKDTNTTYSAATSSTLGLVKIGDTLSDATGYTKVAIKDGIIYYKDTNTTYSTATSSALGLVKVGDTINDTTGYTAVYINNGKIYYKDTNTTYSAATSSTLGLIKIGDTLTDTTGYTKVAIKDGIAYYKDTNTTYTFYNLQFQDSGGTTVDTYKPTTSPTKTLKAGNNVTISAASNVITIASTNTWNAMTGATASANGTVGYINAAPPKDGYNTKFWRADGSWSVPANDNTLYYLTLNGTVNGTSGKTNLGTFYAVATSDTTTANQVWMRNSSNNGYGWRTLGSRAFDSTSYLPFSGDSTAEPLLKYLTLSKTMENSDYLAIHIKNNGGWSGALGTMAGIRVTDATDTVGSFGIAWSGEGYFVVKNLYYDGTFGKSGIVLKVTRSNTQAPGFVHTGHNNNDAVLLAGGSYKELNTLFTDLSRTDNTNDLSITIGGKTKSISLGSNAWNSTEYAKKSGDTMSGHLYLYGSANLITNSGGSYANGIRINRKTASNWATMTIGYVSSNLTAGDSGYDSHTWMLSTPADSDYFNISYNGNTDTSVGLTLKGNGTNDAKWNDNTILHAGNFNTWAAAVEHDHDNRYLKRTTDTFTGRLTLDGNSGLPLFIKGGAGGYLHGIIIKGAGGWSGIVLGDSDQDTSGITSNGYWIGNNGGLFCIAKGSNGNTSTSIYCDGTNWYTNTNLIRHSGDTYVSSSRGYIGGSEITYVNNAGNASAADKLNFERVSDIHATTGWRMFTTTNSSPSNGPVSGRWMLGLTFLPNNDTNGYRNILAFVDCGSNNELWIQTQGAGSWGDWRKILTNANWSSYITNATLGAQPAGNYVPFETTSSRTSVDSTNSYPKFYNLEGNNLISGYLKHFYVINMGHYSGNGYSTQIAMNYDGGSTDSELFIRRELDTTWLPWRRVLHDNNYSSYALPLTGGKVTGTLIVQTDGTGNYNQGIRVNRNSTSSWCLIMIGTPPNSTDATGNSSQTGWLVGTPASSNSLIFCPNNASESVGLCLKGSGNNDMKWNDNTVYHAGNVSNLYWANVNISTLSKENTTPRFLSLSTYKTGTAADYDAMTIHFAGSWSGPHKNYIGGIGVTDGTGIVGRFGISYDGSTGYFSVRGLYNGGYAGTGEVFKVKPGGTYAPNFYTTSDRSKKQNISSFSEHIRKFQLKDTEKWHYGVIAQEVEEIFRDGEEGNMTVNYNSVLSYYVGQLENRVKELEDKLKKYEDKFIN